MFRAAKGIFSSGLDSGRTSLLMWIFSLLWCVKLTEVIAILKWEPSSSGNEATASELNIVKFEFWRQRFDWFSASWIRLDTTNQMRVRRLHCFDLPGFVSVDTRTMCQRFEQKAPNYRRVVSCCCCCICPKRAIALLVQKNSKRGIWPRPRIKLW